MEQVEKRDQEIKKWIVEAADNIIASFQAELEVQEKSGRNDLVTNMDKMTEKMFIKKINHIFPGERILGEEGFADNPTDLKGIVWIIDPIDGTLNFVKQQNDFAIMVAVYEDGVGQMGYIYDVMQQKLYSAIKGQGAYCSGEKLPTVKDVPLKEGLVAMSSSLLTNGKKIPMQIGRSSSGVRMIGSAGLETIQVILGRISAYIAASISPWDIAAGKVIAEEVGLIYTRPDGKAVNLLTKNPALVATPSAHKEIVTLFTEA